jgi:hypothetical protein
MTRPHVLSVVLALVGVRFVVERRRIALAILGFFYAWSYAAPHLLVGLALAASLARWPRDGWFDGRTVLAAPAGVVLGLVIHPQSPNTLPVFYVQNVLVLLDAWLSPHLSLGRELEPATTRSLVENSPGLLLALGLLVIALAAARDRPSSRTCAVSGAALASLGLFLLSARFVEYAAPLAALALASALEEAWPREKPRAASLITILLVSSCLTLFARALVRATDFVAALPSPELHGAARWISTNVPEGSVVAHLSWADFSTLFHEDTRHRYLVGFDPWFLAAMERDAAVYLDEVRAGRRALDPGWLAKRFGARVLVVPRSRPREVDAALAAGLDVLHEDAGGIVFDLPR